MRAMYRTDQQETENALLLLIAAVVFDHFCFLLTATHLQLEMKTIADFSENSIVTT